jgi:hypothetical protein
VNRSRGVAVWRNCSRKSVEELRSLPDESTIGRRRRSWRLRANATSKGHPPPVAVHGRNRSARPALSGPGGPRGRSKGMRFSINGQTYELVRVRSLPITLDKLL